MLDLLMKRRSIRKYEDKPIEKDVLDKLLQGALTSPSGRSIRPWELIVVEDPNVLSKLAASRGGPSAPLARAPMAIVVLADPDKTDVYLEDSSILALVIQLMAGSLGLGSCWIQVRNRFTAENESVDTYVKNILGIPENYKVECMISLGYPAEEKAPHDVDKLRYDKVHYGRF